MRSQFVFGVCAALALLIPGAADAAGKQKTKSNNSNERCVHSDPVLPSKAATALSAACDARGRTYTGGRCFPDEAVVRQVLPASSTKPTPVTGTDCNPSPSKGNPLGGSIVKGHGRIKIAPPTAPSEGTTQSGIK